MISVIPRVAKQSANHRQVTLNAPNNNKKCNAIQKDKRGANYTIRERAFLAIVEIAIEGKLTSRSYETKEGEKRYITEVVCNELLILGKQ